MAALTSESNEKIHALAQRFGVSVEAVMTLYRALRQGNGRAAQFSHPELGGMGQWMAGGMTMVGNMNDFNLKGKVDGLCSELVQLIADQPDAGRSTRAAQPWGVDSGSNLPSGTIVDGGVTLPTTLLGGTWWPAELGEPNAVGSQNEIRYAYFESANRLVIGEGGQLTIYNTKGYHITGLAQQQGAQNTLTFSTPAGHLRLSDLPVISMGEEVMTSGGPALR